MLSNCIFQPFDNTKWCESTVLGIIKNEKYKGDVLSGKTYTLDPISHKRYKNYGEEDMYLIKGNHEAIVSEEEWNEAQKIKDKRSVNRSSKGILTRARFSKQYVFSSKLECGCCGRLFTRRTNNGYSPQTKKVVWTCSNYIKNGKQACPKSKTIWEKTIEDGFVKVFNGLMQQKDLNLNNLLDDIDKTIQNEIPEIDIDKIQAKIYRIEANKKRLLDLYVNGNVSKNDYEVRNQEYDKELQKLRRTIRLTAELESKNKEERKKLDEFRNAISIVDHLDEFDPVIFERIIEKVIIGGINEEGEFDPQLLDFIFKVGISGTSGFETDSENSGIGSIKYHYDNHHNSVKLTAGNHDYSANTCRDGMLLVPPKERLHFSAL